MVPVQPIPGLADVEAPVERVVLAGFYALPLHLVFRHKINLLAFVLAGFFTFSRFRLFRYYPQSLGATQKKKMAAMYKVNSPM